jgi:radical SAM protein with 4Fe4S-binding SPASM domain
MSRLTELVILLNERCNLRCDYCHFRAPDERGEELRTDWLERAVDLFVQGAQQDPERPRVLCFDADGEALASRALLEAGLARAASARREHGLDALTIALATNATLLDPPFVRALRRWGIAVTVSLDGSAACHDHHRRDEGGRGSHAAVLRGLTLLHRSGVPTSLRAVHSPDTLPQLLESWQQLRGHAPPRPIKLRPLRQPAPPWFEPVWVERYTRAYLKAVRAMLRHGAPWQGLPDRARHMAAWLVEGRPRGRCCEVGHGMLWLGADGRLLSCGLLSRGTDSLGHIGEVDDPAALEALLDGPRARTFRAHAPPAREPCASCRWLPGCGGGCPIEALDEKLEPVAPPLCMLYRGLGELLEAELCP